MNRDLEDFISAYDEWAESTEFCRGPLFDRMLEARSELNLPFPYRPLPAQD